MARKEHELLHSNILMDLGVVISNQIWIGFDNIFLNFFATSVLELQIRL